MKSLTRWMKVSFYSLIMVGGFGIYLVRRKTPGVAYQSMVKLFCLTSGRSNDWLSRAIGVVAPRYRFPDASGVLGNMADSRVRDAAVESLHRDGFHVFEQRLPDDMCERLLAYALSQRSEMYPMDGEQPKSLEFVVYDRNRPQAVRYEFRTKDLLRNPDIQKLLADLSFAEVAQQYLGARPVVDVLTMWWLTGFSDRPDAKAAQYFHFDMDRPKWLKFFIHLTDVKPTSGPHTFVSGSHRSGSIPDHLLEKGYTRLTDDEVSRAFAPENILEFTAPKGCILAEDTRGLHKGRHVEAGDRLMLQIQFSNSLFGGEYPKVSLEGPATPDLDERFRQFPNLYSAYR